MVKWFMNKSQRFLKRGFDLLLAGLGFVAFGWLIIICWVISTVDTRQNGFFFQERVGRQGKIFKIIKIRTMRRVEGLTSDVTVHQDPRITRTGAILRKLKLDELPQLINIILGQMSFVGPRPDVVGFADLLRGEDRIILTVRPGITGPASLAFSNEEEMFFGCDDPECYNREVIFPLKVEINRNYVKEYRFLKDISYIADTLTTIFT